MKQRRIWIISELYYPEESATGYLLTKIAEGLAGTLPVSVIAGYPKYFSVKSDSPSFEIRNGVTIVRCKSTSFNKNKLFGRLVNLCTITVSIFVRGLLEISSSDCVLVVTNPPTLPFAIAISAWLRRARCILLVHDVYPDVLVASALIDSASPLNKVMTVLNRGLYAFMDKIVVLGADMRELLEERVSDHTDKIVVIPNWADLDTIHPERRDGNAILAELGLMKKFIVSYAGNMGRTHGLEKVFDMIVALREDRDIHFVFFGSGAKRSWLVDACHSHQLPNVTILPTRKRDDQEVFLNACDIAIISFVPGMKGVSVPSRMYNILSAGKPILAIADRASELGILVQENNVGWVVDPEMHREAPSIIRNAHKHPDEVREMGLRAREVAERYPFSHALRSYKDLFSSC